MNTVRDDPVVAAQHTDYGQIFILALSDLHATQPLTDQNVFTTFERAEDRANGLISALMQDMGCAPDVVVLLGDVIGWQWIYPVTGKPTNPVDQQLGSADKARDHLFSRLKRSFQYSFLQALRKHVELQDALWIYVPGEHEVWTTASSWGLPHDLPYSWIAEDLRATSLLPGILHAKSANSALLRVPELRKPLESANPTSTSTLVLRKDALKIALSLIDSAFPEEGKKQDLREFLMQSNGLDKDALLQILSGSEHEGGADRALKTIISREFRPQPFVTMENVDRVASETEVADATSSKTSPDVHIALMHHPLLPDLPSDAAHVHTSVPNAGWAIHRLVRKGIHIALSGHHHTWQLMRIESSDGQTGWRCGPEKIPDYVAPDNSESTFTVHCVDTFRRALACSVIKVTKDSTIRPAHVSLVGYQLKPQSEDWAANHTHVIPCAASNHHSSWTLGKHSIGKSDEELFGVLLPKSADETLSKIFRVSAQLSVVGSSLFERLGRKRDPAHQASYIDTPLSFFCGLLLQSAREAFDDLILQPHRRSFETYADEVNRDLRSVGKGKLRLYVSTHVLKVPAVADTAWKDFEKVLASMPRRVQVRNVIYYYPEHEVEAKQVLARRKRIQLDRADKEPRLVNASDPIARVIPDCVLLIVSGGAPGKGRRMSGKMAFLQPINPPEPFWVYHIEDRLGELLGSVKRSFEEIFDK